jgi:hypothetical protein
VTIAGIILAVGSYYWVGDWLFLGKILFPVVLAILLLLIVVFDAFMQAKNSVSLPKIIRVLEAYKPYNTHSCILVTEPSILFGHDSWVTVFREENECEILTAHGTVLNRQENGYLQIGITFMPQIEDDVISKIKNNDRSVVSLLLIKPTITKYALEALS